MAVSGFYAAVFKPFKNTKKKIKAFTLKSKIKKDYVTYKNDIYLN